MEPLNDVRRDRFDRRSTTRTSPEVVEGALLERLVAGILLIGALLWGASVLATPDAPPIAPSDALDPAPSSDDAERLPRGDEPARAAATVPDEEEDDEDDKEDDDEDDEGKGGGRGKSGKGG